METLSSVTNIVVGKLFALLEKKYEQWRGLEDSIGFIKRELRVIHGFLHDQLPRDRNGEDPPISAVQATCIDELRDLAHDIEDCLDRFLPCAACERDSSFLRRLAADSRFAGEVERLKSRLEEAHERRANYGVNGVAGSAAAAGGSSSGSANTTDYMAQSCGLVGINVPRQELLDLLLLEDVEGRPERMRVISIVGFGGSGKTTLARAVYDCPDIAGQFDGRAWVVASKHRDDTMGLLSALLGQIRQEDDQRFNQIPQDDEQRFQLQSQVQADIRQHLNAKRYLLVFDDIEEKQWNCIKSTFPTETRSRVLVTTTIKPVANACSHGTGSVYNMRTLNVNHSKDLLQSVLKEYSPELELDLPSILEKCDGLPLALVSVGNFLWRERITECYRNQVCCNLGHHIEKEHAFAELRQVLANNYNTLPGHPLKTCLLYTTVFPNGCSIRRSSLIRRWLAEGYVQCQYPRSSLEVADANLEELMDRNIIRSMDVTNNGRAKNCRAHGIMHEFMLHKSRCDNFIASLHDPDRSKCRHLFLTQSLTSGNQSYMDCGTNPKGKQPRARSLTIFGNAGEFALDYAKCELLRVLDLEECDDLKDDHVKYIYKLLHLKYLGLGSTITYIPRKINKGLHCLQTLDLRKTRINTLPVEIIIMPHLAHLFGKIKIREARGLWVLETNKIEKILSDKSKLQTLAGFVVDKNSLFPRLMVHMNKLRKVKIWCEPAAERNSSISLISAAIQKFTQAGMDTTGAHSLSLRSRKFPNRLLCCLEKSYGYLSSLKLQGELSRFPQFITSLCGLTELCLSSTNLNKEDLSNVCTLHHLLYLKLVESDLQGFIIKNGDFPRMRHLCLVVQNPNLPTVEKGALPHLLSLQLLCKDLVGLSEIKIEYHDYLEEVALDSMVNIETIEIWENEAKKHPNRPKVLFRKRVDPTDAQSTAKYAATERPVPETGCPAVIKKRKFHAIQSYYNESVETKKSLRCCSGV
ncbi:Os11g0222900 [Oryza sativa Japonica Group]|uniref:NB-ARC domain, putative n=4 Tax=Oryza TaxID=4527 RepID=A0A0P0Y0M7_ORYSJ|nr:disease resistance protein RGA4-like [Oryza sativa Japonica Group]AAX95848.1 NB-ARC domain, putative [Oryza sativa Japonica Group]ABA92118.1 NB-ARC domain containing protein, expressed [Oryza sativa Japonica Group]ABG22419.1 NB-ARC domain containing protein, expressed [Oryza sativa Japonica Group]BAF27892.1 Os11g0222900 [Oryza sativa Japonica Group]BAT13265.1 Os11g0222900 [Oryza sativa Japonica Group]|eukprot:NP_001067529.1 Os11g0222900 [Oryza sativa Japonica Group]